MRGVWDLSSETVIENFLAHIGNLRLSGKRPRVKILPEKRSLDQNAMIYAVYGQIAAQCEDQTVAEIRAECKLNYGVPILRAADATFNGFCAKCIDPLTYEQQLKAMRYVDVTSLMTTPQCTEYLDTIIREYSKQGYSLLHPSQEAA